MFHVRGVCRIVFIWEGAPNFVTFSSAFFSAELILSNLSHKNDSEVVWGHAPPGKFLKIDMKLTVMAIIQCFLNNFPANFVYVFGP